MPTLPSSGDNTLNINTKRVVVVIAPQVLFLHLQKAVAFFKNVTAFCLKHLYVFQESPLSFTGRIYIR